MSVLILGYFIRLYYSEVGAVIWSVVLGRIHIYKDRAHDYLGSKNHYLGVLVCALCSVTIRVCHQGYFVVGELKKHALVMTFNSLKIWSSTNDKRPS